MANIRRKINNKLEALNAILINEIIAAIGVMAIISSRFVAAESEWRNILISIGCSLLASSIVTYLSSKYLAHISRIREIIQRWGLEGIYKTRQEMNRSTDEAFEYLENELDIIAFGLRSFRDAKTKIVKEKVKRGLRIRIITLKPSSGFIAQRERDEKEVPGQIKKTVMDLIKWVDELKKESPNPENITIRFYDKLPEDFYFRVDDHIYIGPYLYGIASQQTISYEFKGNSTGYEYYKDYFEKLWNDPEFCQPLTGLNQ
jgi:hypothetical protein